MRQKAKQNGEADSAPLVSADPDPFARLCELQIQMGTLHGEMREAELARELAEVKRKHFGVIWREELLHADPGEDCRATLVRLVLWLAGRSSEPHNLEQLEETIDRLELERRQSERFK